MRNQSCDINRKLALTVYHLMEGFPDPFHSSQYLAQKTAAPLLSLRPLGTAPPNSVGWRSYSRQEGSLYLLNGYLYIL